ncbi:MAG: hypothetical protein IJD21_09260 [Oscillospiraceae bacterium]|nr:hypothetical protein [Oscillospiraceae bacterium]
MERMTATQQGQNQNLFDLEQVFFVLDSRKLEAVEDRLYGYCLLEDGIYEDPDLRQGRKIQPDGRGVYVLLCREGDRITIHQDFNGSFGLYLYETEGWYAISNSFLMLTDYVGRQGPLTLNETTAKHLTVSGLTSMAYTETLANEIRIIPKNARLTLHVGTGALETEYLDYGENSLELNSPEGIQALDRWYSRWVSVFRSLKQAEASIQVALSGGCDSRMVMALALASGIDLSQVHVRSINDGLHTHSEDYEIASEIAASFGFPLNEGRNDQSRVNYSLEDTLNISFYTKLGFHKQMYFKHFRYRERRFAFPGAGGGCIRGHLNQTREEFVCSQDQSARHQFSRGVCDQVVPALVAILNSGFEGIAQNHHRVNWDPTYDGLSHYRETRGRNHFGKAGVEDYCSNVINFSPLMDPEICRLRISDQVCPDKNLLMALIYVRYCPRLLDFRIEGGRSIDEATIAYARQIHARFPRQEEQMPLFDRVPDGSLVWNDPEEQVNEPLTKEEIESCLADVFASRRVKGLFTSLLDEEIYSHAEDFKNTQKYFPLRHCYTVLAICHMLEEVYGRQWRPAEPTMARLNRWRDEGRDMATRRHDQIVETLKDYITARIDAKIFDKEPTDIRLLSVSDGRARIQIPQWFQKGGTGYVVESYNLSLDLEFECLSDGELKLSLKGRFVPDGKGGRVPYWIRYTSLVCCGKEMLKKPEDVWHDKPHICKRKVKRGDRITLHIEWTMFHDTGRQEASAAPKTAPEPQQMAEEEKLPPQEKKESRGLFRSLAEKMGRGGK